MIACYQVYVNRVLSLFIENYLRACYKVGMDRVTTNEALEILRGRGFKVSYPTVARWAQTGALKGAERDDTHPRGPLWLIPRASVLNFEPPAIGRPPKAKPAQSNGKKRGKK
jgi:hypothetical protein